MDLATLLVIETRCRRFDGVHCDSFYQFGDLSCMRQFVVNVSVPVPASSIPFHFTEKFSTWKIRFYRHKINFTKRQKRKIERRQVMDLKIKEGHLQSYLLSVIRLHMHKRFSTVVENHSKSLIFTTLRAKRATFIFEFWRQKSLLKIYPILAQKFKWDFFFGNFQPLCSFSNFKKSHFTILRAKRATFLFEFWRQKSTLKI